MALMFVSDEFQHDLGDRFAYLQAFSSYLDPARPHDTFISGRILQLPKEPSNSTDTVTYVLGTGETTLATLSDIGPYSNPGLNITRPHDKIYADTYWLKWTRGTVTGTINFKIVSDDYYPNDAYEPDFPRLHILDLNRRIEALVKENTARKAETEALHAQLGGLKTTVDGLAARVGSLEARE